MSAARSCQPASGEDPAPQPSVTLQDQLSDGWTWVGPLPAGCMGTGMANLFCTSSSSPVNAPGGCTVIVAKTHIPVDQPDGTYSDYASIDVVLDPICPIGNVLNFGPRTTRPAATVWTVSPPKSPTMSPASRISKFPSCRPSESRVTIGGSNHEHRYGIATTIARTIVAPSPVPSPALPVATLPTVTARDERRTPGNGHEQLVSAGRCDQPAVGQRPPRGACQTPTSNDLSTPRQRSPSHRRDQVFKLREWARTPQD